MQICTREQNSVDEEKVQWCCDADNELCCRLWKKVLQWGSLGQEDIKGMGNLFTDRKKVGNRGGSYIVNLISLLNRIAYREFPWTENKRFFLPVMWIYIPIRYVFRSLIGKRPYKNVLSVLNNSRETQNLFEKMKLFQIDEKVALYELTCISRWRWEWTSAEIPEFEVIK